MITPAALWTTIRTQRSHGSGSTGFGPYDWRPMDVVFGKHSVRAVFLARPEAVRRVVMREGAARYLGEFVDMARAAGVEPELVRSGEFLRMGGFTEEDKHQGIFVVTEPVPVLGEHDLALLAGASVVLVLDQVSNPQNFGTILRTAAFFGLDAVLWLKNRSVDLSPTVSRVAVGGAEFVRLFRVTNLARSLGTLKELGFWVYGLDERGERTLSQVGFEGKVALVVGAEGEGLRQRTKESCDELVRIAGGRRGVESLNAGVAAAVAMAEVLRDRPARGGSGAEAPIG
jgi:23S rRNA (guanosine2251-2'-O)-methyltransferase